MHGKGSAADRDEDDEDDDPQPALGFKIEIRRVAGSEDEKKKCVRMRVRWLKGRDPVLYESFCGMLKRQLEASQRGTG